MKFNCLKSYTNSLTNRAFGDELLEEVIDAHLSVEQFLSCRLALGLYTCCCDAKLVADRLRLVVFQQFILLK